jgi:hypothetical protein
MLAAPLAIGLAPLYVAYAAWEKQPTAETKSAELKEDSVWKDPTKTGPQDTVPSPLVEPKSSSPNRNDPSGTVPQATREARVGALTVVEVGVKEASLKGALLEQIALAKREGKEVLVMTLQDSCKPCQGLMNSLADDRMQSALDPVRIVRVDVEVFKDELETLKIARDRIPGFYLLAGDATPRDGIDGGEWGEDIAENIAPVLGPFVRGKYRKRKQEYKPLPGGGVFL